MSKRLVMLRNRYIRAFMMTLLFYIGGLLWFLYFPHSVLGTEEKPKEKIITLSMSEFVSEKMTPVKETVAEQIEELEVVDPEPIKEETKTQEPIVQKIIPKPVVKKQVKSKPKKRIKKRIKKRVHKKKVHKKIQKRVKQTKSATKPKSSPDKKNRFLNQLRAKINGYKTYPRIAQRRGMQGHVNVRFTILANGRVGSISVSGPKVFHASVKRAVKKAFPISVKNASLSLPMTVTLPLHYQLR